MQNKNKYSFNEYNKKYSEFFQKESQRLLKNLKELFPKSSKKAKIEHVGSTAVPGLGGKEIVDILISVPRDDIEKTKKKLQKLGYKYKEDAGNKERWFFESPSSKDRKTNKKETPQFHIHLTWQGSYEENKAIRLRDLLIKNSRLRKKYHKIKKKASNKAKGNSEKYRKLKRRFLKKLNKKAMKEKF